MGLKAPKRFKIAFVAGTRPEIIKTAPVYPVSYTHLDVYKRQTLSPEIRLHEPKDALVSGSEGLDLIYRILNESSPYLKSQGYLYIEHDPSQVEAIADLSLKTHFKKDHVIFDYQKRPRATVFRRK